METSRKRLENKSCHLSFRNPLCNPENVKRFRNVTDWRTLVSVGCLVLLSISDCGAAHPKCMEGVDFPGVTIPHGDIFLHDGSKLELYCILDLENPKTKGFNASDIDFRITKAPLDPSLMQKTVLNETTALLTIDRLNASTSDYLFWCQLPSRSGNGRKTTVCQNAVFVGYEPIRPRNFECFSYNWTELRCTWNQPSENVIYTRYNLTFRERRGYNECPNITEYPKKSWGCLWSEKNEFHYRRNEPQIGVILTGWNKLRPDGVNFTYTIDHYSIVIPEVPKLVVKAVGSRKIAFTWSFVNEQYFSAYLEHEIDVSGVGEKIYVKTTRTNGTKSLEIPVPYAFTNYTVKVRMRSQTANKTDERLWSKPAIGYAKTWSEVPETPVINIGSYERIGEKGVRRVYWKHVEPESQNGPNFLYEVTIAQDGHNRETFKTKDSWFERDFEKKSLYDISIRTINDAGPSPRSASLTLPSDTNRPAKVSSVTKYKHSNGSVEVLWTPPAGSSVRSYTIFRCVVNISQECDWTSLDWEVLNQSQKVRRMYTFSEHIPYKFAVAANSEKFSSGMIWETCDLSQKRPAHINRLSVVGYDNYAVLSWGHDCTYTEGYIEGYYVTYCQVPLEGTACESDTKSTFITPKQGHSYNITQLQPKTRYKISIFADSKNGQSQTESQFTVTAPSVPGDPPKIQDYETSDTSITLSLAAPQTPNGVIQSYKLFVKSMDSSTGEIGERSFDVNEQLVFVVSGLDINTNYSVRAAACNLQGCSEQSKVVFARTRQGATQMKEPPRVTYNNGTFRVTWDTPEHVGGNVLRFELQVLHNGVIVQETPEKIDYNEGQASYDQEISLNCDLNSNLTAKIRAITRTDDDQVLSGNWSQEGVVTCVGSSNHRSVLLAIGLSIGVLAAVLLLVRWAWAYYKQCKEMDFVLPPGIEKDLHPQATVPKRKPEVINDNNRLSSFPMKYQNGYIDERKEALPTLTFDDETGLTNRGDSPFTNKKSETASNTGLTELSLDEPPHEQDEDQVSRWLWQGSASDNSAIIGTNQDTVSRFQLTEPKLHVDDETFRGLNVSPSVLNPLLPPVAAAHAAGSVTVEPYKRFGAFTKDLGEGDVTGNDVVLNDLSHDEGYSADPVENQSSTASTSSASSASPTTPVKASSPALVPDVLTANNTPYVRWNQLSDFKNDALLNSSGNYCQVGMF